MWKPILKPISGSFFAEPVLTVKGDKKSPLHRKGSFSARALDLLCGADYVTLLKNEKDYAVQPHEGEPATPRETQAWRKVHPSGAVSLMDIPLGHYVLQPEDGVFRLERRDKREIKWGRTENGEHPWR